MDMKDLFESGCFTPAWTETSEEIAESTPIPYRKDLKVLLDELAEIKNNIENLQAKSWYLDRERQYREQGFSRT